MAFVATSCSDEEDYASNKGVLISDSNVMTGDASVSATSATLFGSVSGLESQAPSAYETGFLYGYAQDNLSEKVIGANDNGSFSANISGTTGQSIYYQAYVTLQGKVTYKGEVKSAVLSDAKAITGASEIIAGKNCAKLVATFSNVKSTSESATYEAGVIISGDADKLKSAGVRMGVEYSNKDMGEVTAETDGLLPGKTYYYAAYIDLGNGVVYGETKSFTVPSVSVDVDDEFVDLGLSTKWAKHNIGAVKESDFGGHFGYGDIIGFNSSINPADYASENIYKTANDIAFYAYDGKAMLPTADEYEELFRCCTSEWTEVDGVKGYKFTGPNGNSIFLPSAGSRTKSACSGAGADGHYMTGSINPSDNRFCVSYDFNSSFNARGSQPVYTALSVRAVTTAKSVKYDKALLCKTWRLDLNADAKSFLWDGPIYFYGTNDNWGTISNDEPVIGGDHWSWCPDYAGNSWLCEAKEYGTMTFTEAGDVIIVDAEGNESKGTYTVDEKTKKITFNGVDLLNPGNNELKDARVDLPICSLTENGLQIGAIRANDPCLLVFNYVSDDFYMSSQNIQVNLLCVGGDWNGTWGSQVDAIEPANLNGSHTFKYEGACSSSMVFTLDFKELLAKFPNATVAITDMKCDGKSIAFDGSKFRYGDIEDNGNFRVELFNIWGKAAQGGKVDSPFSNAGLVENDPAFTFAESLEITYNINVEGQTTYTPNLITINPSWGGDWGYSDGTQFDIKINPETALYEVSKTALSMTLNAEGMGDGSIMTFVETNNLYLSFPNIKMSLDKVILDGKALTGWDASKIVNTSADGGGVKHRLELWNMYGETSQGGCAFGTPADGVIKELGFSSSMQLDFTIQSLY